MCHSGIAVTPATATRGSPLRHRAIAGQRGQRQLSARRSPQLLLSHRAQVTRHQRTQHRHLLLFPHAVAIASFKRGSTFRLKHRVRLSELWVPCREEAVAAARPEDEDEVFGPKCSQTLILVWPTGLCVVTFGSQEVKPLWLDTILSQSQGAPGARVTRLPSLRLLTTVVGFYGPEVSLTARTVEALILAQAEAKKCPRADSSAAEEPLCQAAAGGAKGGKKVEISWPLAWRGSSATGDCPGQLGSGPRAALFGQPLALICGQGDALPQPVQELLDILHENGPATEGIFRKAASEKARRELQDELDRGGKVDLSSKPLHLLAVVLKDFLRNIPCKLLLADLYEEWLVALEKPSLQEKTAQLQEVAGKLPPANRLLLQRLLSLLHHISENAESSRMDARNLAICVGPNLLSPAMDDTLPPAMQKESTDKVTLLVELLINNCAAVFADDIALPLGPSTEESPERTVSSTEHPATAQHNLAAFNSPEPAAEGSPATSDLQQPKAASASVSSSCLSCLSAPSLTTWKQETSSMPRSFSEADLCCHRSNLEGRRRGPEVTQSEGHFPLPQTKHSLEERALQTTPCHPQVTLLKRHSLPTTSSGCSLQSSCSPDGSVLTSSPLVPLPSPPQSFLKKAQAFPSKPKDDSSTRGRPVRKHSRAFSLANRSQALHQVPHSAGMPGGQELSERQLLEQRQSALLQKWNSAWHQEQEPQEAVQASKDYIAAQRSMGHSHPKRPFVLRRDSRHKGYRGAFSGYGCRVPFRN
ncbi:LOW QUALITY PROTEIN: T-cell activation Rho GTPase-activating protein-like [Dromaius novaehollandiae]|uniref:LOW QUALITY PROTEIN: T-cell activation Rho GTPase-activating protein-like n=1 Tax=Dromaius novaehollandiae TaxID=8790 RepID=UPI00311EE846